MDPTDSRPHWRPARDTDDTPPPRPRTLEPADLRFTPQDAVRWYSPGVLTGSGLHVGLTSVFGSFLDKRELQARKPVTIDRTHADRDELWIDYAADTGDGFPATMTVASHLARRSLPVDVVGGTETLPRGNLVVLGGDEVYPSASAAAYENRLEGPFRAALPWTLGDHPSMYAIPGNHDWYDGLTGFLRLFTQQRWIGGWTTQQNRSYFAVKLPHNWWLWGIDIQLDMYVDEPQLEFFGEVLEESAPGDKLILATPVPSWTELERDPQAHRNLAFIERTLLRPRGVDLRLTLAGDLHHYTRYTRCGPAAPGGASPAHKITSGGGGAFLHPTHDLRREVEIVVDPDDPDDRATYRMEAAYPDRPTSRRLSLQALWLPFRNLSFMVVPALVNVALLWTNQFGLRSLSGTEETFAEGGDRWGWGDLFLGLFRNPVSAVTVIVVFLGLGAFARTPPWAPRGVLRYTVKTAMAAVHTMAQVVTITAVALVSISLASVWTDGGWFTATASLLDFAIGGVACSLTVGAYLAAANGIPGIRAHGNETFASARITRYKNFLRMHLDGDGRLTVYALGIDHAVPDWRPDPDNDDPEAAWLVPETGEIRPHLIETVVIE
ncbi:MAG: metallophosphoesterase family protein [Acidimicrobiales bacterium]